MASVTKKKASKSKKTYTPVKFDSKAYDTYQSNKKSGGKDPFIKAGIKVFRPMSNGGKSQDGLYRVRIIACPATHAKYNHIGIPMFVHYGIGSSNAAYLSLKMHKQEKKHGRDPLDEARSKLYNAGKLDDAKKLNFSRKCGYWVIDRNNEAAGPQFWPAPDKKVDEALMTQAKDYSDDGKFLVFWDNSTGRDVKLRVTGTKLTTDYQITGFSDEKPLSKDKKQREQWEAFVAEHPLEDCLQFYDASHIKEEFLGGASDVEDDDDEVDSDEEESENEDADEEESDEESEESDDAEEEDEDEEDDESDDEEEEDEEEEDDESDDEEEEDEEDEEDEDDDEEDDDDDEEDDDDDEDAEEEEDDDEEEEEEESSDEDDEEEDSGDSDDDEDEEEDDEEEAKPKRRGRPPGSKNKGAAKKEPPKKKPPVKKGKSKKGK